jgi:stage II sporulation protein R
MVYKRLNEQRYFIFALMIMTVSWHLSLEQHLVFLPKIPTDSIRLRILAHSDQPHDQALKHAIRNSVTKQIELWVGKLQHLSDARNTIVSRIPEIEKTIEFTLKSHGFQYDYHVELARVPFPTKIYGYVIYPAGIYEALRITIGKGEGKNWWCVLFPPLCFVGAKPNPMPESKYITPVLTSNKQRSSFIELLSHFLIKSKKETSSNTSKSHTSSLQKNEKPTIRFYIWEKLKSWL